MSDRFTISQGLGHEVERALARNGWTNALLKQATKGDFFAKVRLVLEGKAEIVMVAAEKAAKAIIQKVTDLSGLVKKTALAATTEKKVSESFVDPRYSYRDGDLDRWLANTSPAGAQGTILAYQLEKELTLREVAAAILGIDAASDLGIIAKALIEGGHTVVLPQIEALIERTDAGEDTGLITYGYANLFFAPNKDESVSIVLAGRHGGGRWDVNVYRLGLARRWGVGFRVFSRDS